MAKKSILERVEGSIERLIADHRRLSEVCNQLTSQREALLAEKREMQEQIISLERELSKLQLCEGLSGADKSRERAKARVNRLMREVDRCIALLNAPTAQPGAEGSVEAADDQGAGTPVDMELEFQSEINDK